MKDVFASSVEYEKRGWSVIPVQKNGKIPIIEWKKYQEERADSLLLDIWFSDTDCNIGIVTGKISGITVIDIDGDLGNESMAKQNWNPPPTYTVKTPNGWHLYYQYHPGYKQGAGILPGIDIRNDGGFVVAPPSVINELHYEVIKDIEFSILPPVASLFGPGSHQKTKNVHNPTWVQKLLAEGTLEGNPGRNDTATRLAGYFRNKNVGIEETHQILTEFAHKCSPPMDLRELRATVESVYHYAIDVQNAKVTDEPSFEKIGNAYVYRWPDYGVVFSVDEVQGAKDGYHCEIEINAFPPGLAPISHGPAKFNLSATRTRSELARHLSKMIPLDWERMIDAVSKKTIILEREGEPFLDVSLLQETSQEQRWIASPFVFENQISVLFGDGATGKSLTALAILLSLETGYPFYPIEPTKKMRGLYLDWESDELEFVHRYRSILRGSEYKENPHCAYYRCTTTLKEMTRALIRKITQEKIDFVVIDSAVPACGSNPESAESVIAFLNSVRSLGVSTLILAHVPKNAVDPNKPFGSGFFDFIPRSLIRVQKHQEAGEDSLRLGFFHTKSNSGPLRKPFGVEVLFMHDTIKFVDREITDIPELAQKLSLKARIRLALFKGPHTVKELSEELGSSEATIRMALNRYVLDFEKNEEGQWFLRQKGG